MTVGLAALAGGAAYAFKQFEDSQKVVNQTAAVLESTGGAANVTAKHVADLAGVLSEKTAIDDEVIQSGENMILTFKNISNEAGKGNAIFDRTVKTTTDLAAGMAAASGGEVDLKGASIQLGKALNDPIAGISSLTRVGVTFNEQQKAQIAQYVKHNNLLAAQKVILQEVNSEFKGSAEANATASASMQVALGNLAETVGGLLAPAITKIVGWIEKLAEWFTALPKGIQQVITIGAVLAATIALIVKAFGLAGVAVKAFNLLLSLNPYVLIIAATIALTVLIVKNWDTIVAFLKKTWDTIVAAAKWAWDHLAIFILGPMKLVIDFLIDHWRGFKDVFLAIWDGIRDGVKAIVGPVIAVIKTIVHAIQDLIGWIRDAISWLSQLGSGAGKQLGGFIAQTIPQQALPGAQTGGFVARTGAAVIHRGEHVVPAGQVGAVTLNVYGWVGDEQKLTDKLHEAFLRKQNRNASLGFR